MTAPRLALAVVVIVVASTIGVGATTAPGGDSPAATTQAVANETAAPPMGANISMFMQANAAQAEGSVENGMWVAAYARSNATTERRALVERRIGSMNASMADLRAERRALQEAFRNGTIDRVTYQARLSTIVGQLAALSEGIEETSVRGRAVGVNETRLETLRTQARDLGGGEVSRIARNLSADPPGRAGVFGDDRPGPPGDTGPPDDASNRSSAGGNATGDEAAGNGQGSAGSQAGEGRDDGGQGHSSDEATTTPDD